VSVSSRQSRHTGTSVPGAASARKSSKEDTAGAGGGAGRLPVEGRAGETAA
jgi:hypothetical protein